MANIKISELEKLTNVASDDYFPIVDSSAGKTKKTEINSILNLVFPIGRGFIDFTDTDYSNYLGFTWERELIGMTPIGLDVNDNDFNTIGKTGGGKEHYHIMPLGFDNGGYIYGKGDKENNPYYGSIVETVSNRINLNPTTYSQTTFEQNAPVRIAYTSNENSLQPYQVVAYWKRIA